MATFEEIKKRFDEYAANPEPIHPRYFGVCIGMLTKACGGDEPRHYLQYLLTGKLSTRIMTPGEKYALTKFVKAHYVQKENGWAGYESELGSTFNENIRTVMQYGNDSGIFPTLF